MSGVVEGALRVLEPGHLTGQVGARDRGSKFKIQDQDHDREAVLPRTRTAPSPRIEGRRLRQSSQDGQDGGVAGIILLVVFILSQSSEELCASRADAFVSGRADKSLHAFAGFVIFWEPFALCTCSSSRDTTSCFHASAFSNRAIARLPNSFGVPRWSRGRY